MSSVSPCRALRGSPVADVSPARSVIEAGDRQGPSGRTPLTTRALNRFSSALRRERIEAGESTRASPLSAIKRWSISLPQAHPSPIVEAPVRLSGSTHSAVSFATLSSPLTTLSRSEDFDAAHHHVPPARTLHAALQRVRRMSRLPPPRSGVDAASSGLPAAQDRSASMGAPTRPSGVLQPSVKTANNNPSGTVDFGGGGVLSPRSDRQTSVLGNFAAPAAATILFESSGPSQLATNDLDQAAATAPAPAAATTESAAQPRCIG